MLATCRPLGIEIYELENRDDVLKDWKQPLSPDYKGLHGIRMGTWQGRERDGKEGGRTKGD